MIGCAARPSRTGCRCGSRWSSSVLLLVTVALGASGAAGTYVLRGYLVDRVDIQLNQAGRHDGRPLPDYGERGRSSSSTTYLQLAGRLGSARTLAVRQPDGGEPGLHLTPTDGNAEPATAAPARHRGRAEAAPASRSTPADERRRRAAGGCSSRPLPDDSGTARRRDQPGRGRRHRRQARRRAPRHRRDRARRPRGRRVRDGAHQPAAVGAGRADGPARSPPAT